MLGFIILSIISVYLFFEFKFLYWRRKSVIGPKPTFPFGNIKEVLLRRKQFFQPYCDSYNEYKDEPYVGMFCFYQPVLCVRDPAIAKLVLIKNFDHFQAHGIFSGGVGDPLAGHMFNVHGDRWKNLRSKISPSFSSGKLKTMYPIVHKIAKDAMVYIDMLHSNNETVNFSEFYAKYIMEIIGSVGFGVECNGFSGPHTEFFVRGEEYFEPRSLYWNFVRALAFFAPKFFELLKINRINPDITQFFITLVRDTVQFRRLHSFKRNDYLQTLIDLESSQGDSHDGKAKKESYPFSMDDLSANTMLYMFAGYETSATVGQFAVYELALNPHVQNKAREEIIHTLAKYDGEITYEAQAEMTYINMVFDESMRKYPPLRSIFRRCTKEFQLPDDGLIIEKGTMVFIPNQAIQMDPTIFEDPEKFDPERFSNENKSKLHPCHWMPFGEGPRKCLGLRQSYIQTKIALVMLLQKYELLLDKRTPVPMRLKAKALSCTPDGGIWVKLRKL